MSKQERCQAVLYFDGACEPVNPGGVIAWGWVLEADGGELLDSGCGVDELIGLDNTSNVAEYTALIAGLEAALEGGVASLHVRGDSKMIVSQMQGDWGCLSERLRPFYDRAWELRDRFEQIRFEWILREHNEEADRLTRLAYAEAAKV